MSYNKQGYSYYNPYNRRHYPPQGETVNTQDVTYRGFLTETAAIAFCDTLVQNGDDAEHVKHGDEWVVIRHGRAGGKEGHGY
jgi:hypothetical protein